MAGWMRHRGPDGQGVFTDGPLGLCHRRLAVLDLSAAAGQPMHAADGSACIVYNGECYNFAELRDELRALGRAFITDSDTEVVLQGYLQWGDGVAHRLVGMFAFAVWDRRDRSLRLFRDRLGVKPLYFSLDSDRLVFASEVKPLLEAGVAPALNRAALGSYLMLRYAPGRETMFAGVRTLAPGHRLAATADGRVTEAAWWSLDDVPGAAAATTPPGRFLELLRDAVGGAMTADVPVGALLSGGVDSGAVVALMRAARRDVEAFTYAMRGPNDESAAAAALARSLGVGHSVRRGRADDFAAYSRALYFLEEPLGDAIIAPTLGLAAHAAERVKVVLTGEGADEILGGYAHHFVLRHAQQARAALPAGSIGAAAALLRATPWPLLQGLFPYPARLSQGAVGRLADAFAGLVAPPAAYCALVALFSPTELRGLLDPAALDAESAWEGGSAAVAAHWRPGPDGDFLNDLIRLDLGCWNPSYTLLRLDKLTMAHSLEARVPYLDHRLVAHCLGSPGDAKMGWVERKRMLREALRGTGLLPEAVRRAPKRPFYLAVEQEHGGGFRRFVDEVLSEAAVRRRGLFQPRFVAALRGRAGRDLLSDKQLMALALFELWARLYLDGAWRNFDPGGGA